MWLLWVGGKYGDGVGGYRLSPLPSPKVLTEAPGAPLKSIRKKRASLSLIPLEALRLILLGLAWLQAPS